jgi:hypothetical protein
VELATLEWLDWFNNRRLFEPIATVPTAEAEARYQFQLEELPNGSVTQRRQPPANCARFSGQLAAGG